MEDCHEEWLSYIRDQRSLHFSLNYFTTQQLVILRKQLACLANQQQTCDPFVYALLSTIRKNCNEFVVKQALRAAMLDIQKESENEGMNRDVVMETEDQTDEAIVAEDNAQFLKEMIGSGYSEKMAQRALAACGNDVDEGIFLSC